MAAGEGTTLKHQYQKQLQGHLSKKASFTMLMRSMPAVIKYVPAKLLD